MASGSKDSVDEVVRRVTSEVLGEVRSNEVRTFGVADLRAHVSELAGIGGDASAWKITYDTKRTPDIAAGIGGDISAWKITYDTKRSPDIVARIIEGTEKT